jgi:proteasome accessory factor A
MTALEIQWDLYDRARKYAEERGLAELGPEPVGQMLLERWEAVLAGLESDPSTLRHQLDWVAKYELINAYCARHECGIGDSRVAALDLQYHDLRPERSLFRRLGMETLIDTDAVEDAVMNPPRDTRAYFRGECLKRFGRSIVAANWDSIVFDLGEDPLRRVPMMEPLRGSAAHVDTLFDGCMTPAELLRRLGA